MPKTKNGEVITWKTFFSRWKNGINGITPLQQIKMQVQSMYIVIMGIIFGIIVSILAIKSMWWVLIILIGALYNVIITQIGLIQKKNMLKQFEQLNIDMPFVK